MKEEILKVEEMSTVIVQQEDEDGIEPAFFMAKDLWLQLLKELRKDFGKEVDQRGFLLEGDCPGGTLKISLNGREIIPLDGQLVKKATMQKTNMTPAKKKRKEKAKNGRR